MSKLIDMTGKSYGRLTVSRYVGKQRWECVCTCGVVKTVSRSNLVAGQIKSCGCLFKDVLMERNTTHNMSRSAEYKSWSQMKNRCLNQNSPDYKYYGGRGIKVCDEWLVFENFLKDMGHRTKNQSLDRIDNSGNYEPGNCRWTSTKAQANNRRTTTHLTAFGETKPFSAWVADSRCRVSYCTLSQRIRQYGWDAERAIATNPRPVNKRKK